MRDGKIKLTVCESQRRAAVLDEKPFRMDTKQFANRAFGAGHGRNIFDLKQHLRESKGVMLTSRCSTNFRRLGLSGQLLGLRRLLAALVCGRLGAAFFEIPNRDVVATSCDRPKALTSQRTPKLPDIRCQRLQP